MTIIRSKVSPPFFINRQDLPGHWPNSCSLRSLFGTQFRVLTKNRIAPSQDDLAMGFLKLLLCYRAQKPEDPEVEARERFQHSVAIKSANSAHTDKTYRPKDDEDEMLYSHPYYTRYSKPYSVKTGNDEIECPPTFKVRAGLDRQDSFQHPHTLEDNVSLMSKTTKSSQSSGKRSNWTKKTASTSRSASRHTYRVSGVPAEIVPKGRSQTKIIRALVHQLNNVTTAEDIVAYFVNGDSPFIPEDVDPIPMKILAGVNVHLHMSFPDMEFSYESIKQRGPDLVVVEGAQFSGTHIGEPYTAMPGMLPALPPSGTYVLVDKERWFFEMEGEKVKSWTVVALGPVTGPAGVYESLGGSLKPPKKR